MKYFKILLTFCLLIIINTGCLKKEPQFVELHDYYIEDIIDFNKSSVNQN